MDRVSPQVLQSSKTCSTKLYPRQMALWFWKTSGGVTADTIWKSGNATAGVCVREGERTIPVRVSLCVWAVICCHSWGSCMEMETGSDPRGGTTCVTWDPRPPWCPCKNLKSTYAWVEYVLCWDAALLKIKLLKHSPVSQSW